MTSSAMLVAWSPMRSRFLATRMSSNGGEDHAGIVHHVSEQFAEDLVAKLIDLIVALAERFAPKLDVAADHGIRAVADHSLGKLAHARQIDVGLHVRMAKDAHGGLRDVYGLVADALEVAVDAGNGQEKAQIAGHRRVKSEQALNARRRFRSASR